MFWGLTLEVGKRYSQTVEKSFHISMAALTGSSNTKGHDHSPKEVCKKSDGQVTVMVEVEKASYPICTLQPGMIPQQALDYIFTEGEEVLFYTEGDLDVHLTGYLIDEPSPFEYGSDEESASGSNAVSSDNEQDNKKKRKKSDNESSEEEDLGTLISELDDLNEDNDEMVNIWLQRSDRNKRKKESAEDDGAAVGSSLTGMLLDNGDSEESEDDDWMPGDKQKMKKKQKAERKSKQESKNDKSKKEDTDSKESSKKLNTSISKQKNLKRKSCDSSEAEDKNDDSKLNSAPDTPFEESPEKRKLPSGLIVEDIVKGGGKKAKRGRQVSVHYKGCLQKTMKEFDSCLKGKPFKFRVGQGEVIKGWDMGVEGMQIGGKRRLTVPPSLGYGSKQMGSSIPPNSTLIFVVELLEVI